MWGVGRHNLGAQVFDYWADPWRHVHEHWTDTDLLNFAKRLQPDLDPGRAQVVVGRPVAAQVPRLRGALSGVWLQSTRSSRPSFDSVSGNGRPLCSSRPDSDNTRLPSPAGIRRW